MEREKGVEPSSQAWKARALPLSYTRMLCCRVDDGVRTHDLHLGKVMLYRLSYIHEL